MIYFLVLITWLVAVNITAYFLMRKDKIRAVRHGWRIPENTFFLFCLSGGFSGVYCGMQRFGDAKRLILVGLVALWVLLLSPLTVVQCGAQRHICYSTPQYSFYFIGELFFVKLI